MNLTAQERSRFAQWLEVDGNACEEMAKQLEKNSGGSLVEQTLIKRFRVEALAAQVIAKKLRSIEEVTIEDHGANHPDLAP